MANRRMFSQTVVDDDAFLELPVESRALYFHLGMHTDDEGFVGGVRGLCRKFDIDREALGPLVDSGFVEWFDTGVVFINDHKENNKGLFRKDRIKPTEHQTEKMMLDLGTDICPTNDGQMATNGVLTKPNLTELNPTEPNQTEPNQTEANAGAPSAPNPAHACEEPPEFDRPPTLEEVKAYAATLPEPRPSPYVFMVAMQSRGWVGVTDWRDELANREW